jgi:hypothetical protein
MFDCVAELMGVSALNFVDTYKTEVQNMKVILMQYVTALWMKQSHPDLPFYIGDSHLWPELVFLTTPDGYSIIPVLTLSANMHKKDWECAFTHYSTVLHL